MVWVFAEDEVDDGTPGFGGHEGVEFFEGFVEGFDEAVGGETGFGVWVVVEALFEGRHGGCGWGHIEVGEAEDAHVRGGRGWCDVGKTTVM